ncbi:PREDICTED: protein yellow-like isoform X2 [Nicrophorus vespilloides]|uniref:Protein yellow-like isoform X2 n=1 Tax=Nicrophorus vespilloides TaxID=110193 RepID=A0ABM1MW16_NICVS|nr:PREDICTED: protein yellow-like isoform X2 [Nicrophorus vespilloides]
MFEKMKYLCLVLGICSNFAFAMPSNNNNNNRPGLLSPVFEWKQMEFEYESEAAKQRDIASGFYVPHVPAPIDVDVSYSGSGSKVFVTIPRFQVGSPVTLGSVNSKNQVVPYPSWSWHRNPESCLPDRLISVYRIKIDECGRMWVLDTGRYGDHQTCEPQIIAFDTNTNAVLHRFTIPKNLLESRSVLVTPIIDNRDKQCRDTFVYVADCQTYSIIVYDVKHEKAWKATDKTMYPYPNFGTYRIQGDSFDLMDGVLGMDLERYHPDKDRKLFYHAMSSPTENWVYTSHLRNETRFKHSPESSPEIFNTLLTNRPSQSAAEAIDKDGIMFFGLMTETSINCWNTANVEYGRYIDTVIKDTVRLQFASGVKVVTNSRGQQELWTLTSRFQKLAAGTLNPNDVNFRVSAGKVSDLLDKTKCRTKMSGASTYGGGYTGSRPTFGVRSTLDEDAIIMPSGFEAIAN